jgi:hypothetical protein
MDTNKPLNVCHQGRKSNQRYHLHAIQNTARSHHFKLFDMQVGEKYVNENTTATLILQSWISHIKHLKIMSFKTRKSLNVKTIQQICAAIQIRSALTHHFDLRSIRTDRTQRGHYLAVGSARDGT